MNILVFAKMAEIRKVLAAVAIFALVLLSVEGIFATPAYAANPSASLEQCRNGDFDTPNDCVELGAGQGWASGNAGDSNSHYVEGESIPYRLVMNNVPTDVPTVLTLSYAVKKGDRHAIDYLTSYDRISENVDPTDGVTGVSGMPSDTHQIPTPSTTGTPVAGQPETSFNALSAAEKLMSVWNADITDISYVSEGDLSNGDIDTVIQVTFNATDSTVVLAWGGHIASRLDWGYDAGDVPLSAGGISGSSYHMSIDDWNHSNLGKQDRSLSAGAVAAPGNVTITKVVVNDNGGALQVSDFPLFVSGNQVNSGVPNDFDAGTYTVSETGSVNYDATISGDCDPLTGELVVAEGQTYSCTITNNDIAPSLTLNKIIAGGPASATDFVLEATGTLNEGSISGAGTVSSDGTFKAGTYVLTETDNSGISGNDGHYLEGSWQCNGGTLANGNELTIELGEDVTCSITNTYVPPKSATLKVVKNLIQDNGGSEDYDSFSFLFDGQEYFWDAGVATKTIILPESDLGVYTVTENVSATVVDGRYKVSYDNCIDIDLSTDGSEETCTITNDDIEPQLTVTKVVKNDSGTGSLGVSDFPLFVDQTQVTSGVQNGFSAADYVVSETSDPGYTATISGDCDAGGNVSLDLGDVKSCTITNDDLDPDRAYITVIKNVVNDNNGTLKVSDFPLFVDQTQVTSGVVHEVFVAGDYTVSETNQTGYAAGDWGGDCLADGSLNGVVLGGTYTCTITNNDIQPKLTVTKVVQGGTASAEEFTINVTGTNVSSSSFAGSAAGVELTLDAGSYSVSEGDSGDYTVSYSDECSGTIAVGEEKNCVITNSAYTVTGFKWHDLAELDTGLPNGIFDKDEKRLADWEIVAFDGVNYVSATTSESGYYKLALGPGTWTISEVMQGGWVQTYPDQGSCQFTFDEQTTDFDVECDFGNHLLRQPSLSCDLFEASPNSGVNPGENVTLTWETSDADWVSIDNGVGDDLAKDGQAVVNPNTDTLYTLTARRYLTDYDYQYLRTVNTDELDYEEVTCQTLVDVDPYLYRIEGYVWHDEDEDGEWDEGDENPLNGWTVKITNGEVEYTTTSDGSGYYRFDVTAGTWTITETVQSGWEQTFPNTVTHVVTVPADLEEEEEEIFTLVEGIMNFLLPTAHAATVIETFGDYNFGNVEADNSTGGSGGTRTNRTSGGSSDTDAGPTPQVLGEQVSVVPAGAPDTGRGGSDRTTTPQVIAWAAMVTRNRKLNAK